MDMKKIIITAIIALVALSPVFSQNRKAVKKAKEDAKYELKYLSSEGYKALDNVKLEDAVKAFLAEKYSNKRVVEVVGRSTDCKDLNEAKDFLNDKYLGGNLLEITAALLALESNDIGYIMGSPDDMKLRSCMTLFSAAAPQEKIFTEVLEKYFGGKADNITQNILKAAADS